MFRDFNNYIKEIVDWLATPLALLVFSYVIGGISYLPQEVIVIAYVITSAYLLFDKELKIERQLLVFLIYLPLNILLARPDSVFQPWLRFLFFVVLFLTTSPIISTTRALKFRKKCFHNFAFLCVLLGVGSFVAYFLGINLFVDRYEGGFIDDYLESVGTFAGLSRHSMLLGPLSAIGAVYLFYYAIKDKTYIFFIPIICCIGSSLFAASRAAVIAMAFGFIIVIFYSTKHKSVALKRIIIISICFIATYPLWQDAASGILQKQQSRAEAGGIYDSRTLKVECRINEFKSSPIIGVGFASIDPLGEDTYNIFTGTCEPGTSWLAIFSMTGIVGFLLFIVCFIKSYKYCAKHLNDAYLLGILSFFIIHMLVEGYIFAAGSPLAFILWLSIGTCYDSKEFNERQLTLRITDAKTE